MRRFAFSLEALLRLRQAKAQQQEQKLAAAVSTYNRGRQALGQNRQAAEQTWQHLAQQVPDVPQSHASYLYLERLQRQGQAIDAELQQAHAAVAQEQGRYAEIKQGLRLLERLRQKQYGQYRRDCGKQQDEVAAQPHQTHKGQ